MIRNLAQLLVGVAMMAAALAVWIYGPDLDRDQAAAVFAFGGLGFVAFMCGLDADTEGDRG